MSGNKELIIGIDAGTSVIKAVAFDLQGRQIATASVENTYSTESDGTATQSLQQTWVDCTKALRKLGEVVTNLSDRAVAVSITGQGDGTWLVGADETPVSDAWLWLDVRAASTVNKLASKRTERQRFEMTGTGLNCCQQGAQMSYMDKEYPELLNKAEVALHCKDWLYLNMTGVRATDPSEASFTFGNFRTRTYEDSVIESLELSHRKHLLPEIIDGTQTTHGLSAQASKVTGLKAGTPVSLGYVDMVMTALGAGVYTRDSDVACSTIGSTGVHMRASTSENIILNNEGTGYVIALPATNMVTQVQTNMAATLNLDWLLNIAAELIGDGREPINAASLIPRIDQWYKASRASGLLYHPYISDAGERGPFINADSQAGFIGLSSHHSFADLVRAVVEGLGMATRDCYSAMGELPSQLRITGGAARSKALREVLGASLDAHVCVSSREEAGAAGAAMMAAVANGVYSSMEECIDEWVTPLLGEVTAPNADLIQNYELNYQAYVKSRRALEPTWAALVAQRKKQ